MINVVREIELKEDVVKAINLGAGQVMGEAEELRR